MEEVERIEGLINEALVDGHKLAPISLGYIPLEVAADLMKEGGMTDAQIKATVDAAATAVTQSIVSEGLSVGIEGRSYRTILEVLNILDG